MKLGTLRKSSALLACALLSGVATAIAADNTTIALGLHETRTPAITLTNAESSTAQALAATKKTSKYASACTAGCTCASCAGATKHYTGLKRTGVDKSDIQKAFFITTEDVGAVYLMDVKRDGAVGGLTKMKTVDLAPPSKKSLWVNATNGSSDKVRGTGQQYGADMAHRRGVVIASVERPDASA